jgi:hypothetical protein
MVGLNRLDDVQSCVESVVADGVEGDLIEAGTWRGGASILMRATLDTLAEQNRTVVVADSFAGFPAANEQHPETQDLAEMDYIAVPLEEVQANFARFGLHHGVDFVPGFFSTTMPGLQERSWSVMRLDGDSYEATSITLRALYPGLAVGGYVLIDDYSLEPCQRAVDEFRERHGITEPIEQVDWTSVRWRRTDSTPIEEAELPTAPSNGITPNAVEKPRAHVPDIHELALRDQLAERERELTELRAQLGSGGWLRRKLRRGA